MQLFFSLASLAALAAASPAQVARDNGIDFASINAVPSPSATGPAVTATSQIIPYNSVSASAVGVASATAAASSSKVRRNSNYGCDWGSWWWCQQTSSSSAPKSTTSSTTPSQAKITFTSVSASSTSSLSSTATTTTSNVPYVTPAVSLPCATQPDGYGPKVVPDTPEAFLAYPAFQQEAKSAITPQGYVATFKDLNASVTSNTYLGLETYTTYNVTECAAFCDATNLCTGFNIFVERDPSVNPSVNCTNPASITNYKCTIWGSSVNASSATNTGQYRDEFQVVITGSDGYSKAATTTPSTQPGWTPPKQNPPGQCYNPSLGIGSGFFPGPFDPTFCSGFAAGWNQKHGSGSCGSYNAFMLKRNGVPQGTYCTLFGRSIPSYTANWNPGQVGSDFWDVETSWNFGF